MAAIKLYLQAREQQSSLDRSTCLKLEDNYVGMALHPIDNPSPSADGISQLFCTPVKVRLSVIGDRKKLKKEIMEFVESEVDYWLNSMDTEMGYDR